MASVWLWTGSGSGPMANDGAIVETESTETSAANLSQCNQSSGDWYKKHELLSESALTLNFNATYVFQGVPAGGFEGPFFTNFSDEGDTGNTLGGELSVELDTGKAGWWEGGLLKTQFQARTGKSILERAGTIAAVNNEAIFPIVLDRFDGNALAITELTYEQAIGEKMSVFAGLLNASLGDANAISGSSLSHSHFLNFAMLYSLVEDASVPHVALGGGINLQPMETISGSFSVFGSAETAGENPFSRWRGTTFSSEWAFDHALAELGGTQTFGALYGINALRTDIAADPRLVLVSLLLGLPIPTTESDTWAVYYNAHQFLQGDVDGGWGVFARLGISDGNPNFVTSNFSGGIGGIGLFPHRKQDSWGLGVYYLKMSDEDLLNGLGVKDEVGGEVYYNIALSSSLHVTVDTQVIDSGLPRVDKTCVLGLRTHFDF